jgi:hypothetical protein
LSDFNNPYPALPTPSWAIGNDGNNNSTNSSDTSQGTNNGYTSGNIYNPPGVGQPVPGAYVGSGNQDFNPRGVPKAPVPVVGQNEALTHLNASGEQMANIAVSSSTMPVYIGPSYNAQQLAVDQQSRTGVFKPTATDSYFQGGSDAYMQYLISLQQTDPSQYRAIQEQLYQSGAYGRTKPVLGSYSTTDGAVIQKALGEYTTWLSSVTQFGGKPETFQWFLKNQKSLGLGPNSGGGGGKAPLTISYTDPAELHAALQNAAQSALGRNLNSEELAKFVAVFHRKEASAQETAYHNGRSTTNPEVTGESYDFVQGNNTKEANQRHEATLLDALNSLVGAR